jgi:hypothetical protein
VDADGSPPDRGPLVLSRSHLLRKMLIDAEKNPEIIEDYAKE